MVALIAAAFLLGSVSVGPLFPALAQTTSTSTGVAQTGWFTRTQDPTKTAGQEGTTATCLIPPNPSLPAGGGHCLNVGAITGGTPGYPRKDNYLYVARINSQDDAHAFVEIDLSGIPFGAVVRGMSFEFQVENETDVGTINVDVNRPGVRACLVITEWVGGESGNWDFKPSTDCTVTAAVAKLKEETRQEPDPSSGANRPRRVVTYGIDLLPMAAVWAEDKPNYGIAFQPTTDAGGNYQVAFRTPSGIAPDAMVARVTYDPPEEPEFGDSGDFESGLPSFGGFTTGGAPVPGTGAFSVEPPARAAAPVRAVSNPVTPWWVWLILPVGLAGLAAIARAAVADVVIEDRVGPVTRLMQQRSAMR